MIGTRRSIRFRLRDGTGSDIQLFLAYVPAMKSKEYKHERYL